MFHRPLPFYNEIANKDFIKALREAARGKNVLFHGTSLGSQIARTDTLLVPFADDPSICFTRSPEVAVHFATLPRDYDDGAPTVFMFDRDSLRSRYRLELADLELEGERRQGKNEMEEFVWNRDVQRMSRHLLAVVFGLNDQVFTLTDKREIKEFVPIARACALYRRSLPVRWP